MNINFAPIFISEHSFERRLAKSG